jgi:transposase
VEGTMNRIKRHMYGRTPFDLLRKRILIRQLPEQTIT